MEIPIALTIDNRGVYYILPGFMGQTFECMRLHACTDIGSRIGN